jgi:hypothetical protein
MKPVFADYAAQPPRLGNAYLPESDRQGPPHHGDHVILGNGQAAAVCFDLEKGDEVEQATLGITALSSKRGSRVGHSPLTVHVNGHALVDRFTIPGGGDLPQDLRFAVPGDWLLPGRNTVEVRNGEDAATYLWLYRITVEEVFDRGAAQRAMAADAVREAVFTYATEHRSPDEGRWTEGPRLRIHVDRGEQSLPAQLSWSRGSGSEWAISFQSAMTGFSGYQRIGGAAHEVRGSLAERAEFREDALGGDLPAFETEEGWGGAWHRSAVLRLAVGDGSVGGGAPRRLAWRDQRGNSAAIGVSPGGRGFLGYYQRHDEGPIGYRGTALGQAPASVSALGDGEKLGHELEEIGRHARAAAQHAADLVADWLKPRR